MQSSTVLAFRIFVMLSCLIIVPMAAIFGSAFPDVVKSVLVDRLVEWSTGKKPEPPAAEAPGGFGALTPAAAHGEAAQPGGKGVSEAPRWNAAGDSASWPAAPSGPEVTAVVPAGATVADPSAGASPAHFVVPAEQLPPPAAAGEMPPGGAAAGQIPTRAGEPTDPFTSMERKLRSYGATYYLLETWGNEGELYRFHCKMAIGNNPSYTRHFEATDRDALRAMSQVLERVESWRSGRPQ
jgi:hypothetical protein